MQRTILRQLACLAAFAGFAATASGQILTKPTITSPTIYTTAGRYRVTISGFATAKETVDKDTDGRKDEVYAAAAFVLWDRRDGHMISTPNVIWTRDYGDVRGQNTGRIQAGTASRQGGLWGGNGPDYAPAGLDPRATVGPIPQSDQLPLLVFEGGLSDGAEALLVAPSLWENDGNRRAFDNYSNSWKTGGVAALINSPAVQNQLTSTTLTSAMVPGDQTLLDISVAANILSGGIIGSYMMALNLISTGAIDRPIGLTPYQNADQYQDRVVVVTREKLASLAVGQGMTIAIPYWEPLDNFLNGIYTAYLRVERTQ